MKLESENKLWNKRVESKSSLKFPERWNPRKVSLTEVFRGVQLGLEAAMDEPLTQVNGVVSILDMKGLSLTQVMQFTPSFAKMVIDWIQVRFLLFRIIIEVSI